MSNCKERPIVIFFFKCRLNQVFLTRENKQTNKAKQKKPYTTPHQTKPQTFVLTPLYKCQYLFAALLEAGLNTHLHPSCLLPLQVSSSSARPCAFTSPGTQSRSSGAQAGNSLTGLRGSAFIYPPQRLKLSFGNLCKNRFNSHLFNSIH